MTVPGGSRAGDAVVDLVHRARNPHALIHEQHAAFGTLVERFETMAFATAFASCEDPELARDACQEAFLVAWRTLPRLREPAAFGVWLKRLVRTQCARARRRSRASVAFADSAGDAVAAGERTIDPAELVILHESQRSIRQAVGRLPAEERDAIVLFYFLGESLRAVARALGVSVGRAGKSVYTARLRLRRQLPRNVFQSFLAVRRRPALARRIQAGAFDECVGAYRFAERPDDIVVVRREGDALVGYAGGQRNILTSRRANSLSPTEFDGEARFGRNRQGRISHFIYYEFGRRLGVAKKLRG